jgi:hypothetical protein
MRAPSPSGLRSAPDVRRAPRRKHRMPSQRQSSGYARRCRRMAWVRSVRMEFESIYVNTAVTRSRRVGRSLAFSSVRPRRGPLTVFHRKSEMIAHVGGGNRASGMDRVCTRMGGRTWVRRSCVSTKAARRLWTRGHRPQNRKGKKYADRGLTTAAT